MLLHSQTYGILHICTNFDRYLVLQYIQSSCIHSMVNMCLSSIIIQHLHHYHDVHKYHKCNIVLIIPIIIPLEMIWCTSEHRDLRICIPSALLFVSHLCCLYQHISALVKCRISMFCIYSNKSILCVIKCSK